ncbi:hypothetical protein Micbo1qcDRAFT_161444 [Microdochium bolleyi]|uniref:Uncharacterized protein n=1 Tax=Microdochium bolleyi TaxID=196109 RepID=A0A136J8E7_9PEZI|nr:hypothetical protein Micbo1qcDRAFT_161444 [Microdochium bolleyi]
MDDPWGSPWAEPSSKPTLAPAEPPSALLSPPPRAFFAATSPGASPWGDDAGGFGDWAEPGTDRPDESPTSPNWGAWGETSPKRPTPNTQLDHNGKASPVVWPGSAAPSPRLSPLPRSRTSPSRRPSATDPWAAELSQSLARVDDPTPNVSESGQKSRTPNEQQLLYENPSFAQSKTAAEAADIEPPTGSVSNPEQIAQDETQDVASSPRPSMTTSVDSTHAGDGRESPITPLEEAKQRVQPVSRSASGKVQELVGMFDSLARSASEEPEQNRSTSPEEEAPNTNHAGTLTLSTDNTSSRPCPLVDEDQDNIDVGQPGVVSFESSASPATPTSIFNPQAFEHDTEMPAALTEEHYRKHSIAITEIVAKHGPMDFRPDLEAFEKAFAKISPPPISTTDGLDPQNAVIKDSFGEISERKTWYRISRFGSMRKHDLGDDENYTRVTWPVTTLHDDTIVIVRRWMEEDSFVGKSMLGGNKRRSVFNWDSSAAPVDLSTIYARKSSLEHERSSSESVARRAAQSPSQPAGRYSRHTSQSDAASFIPPHAPLPAFGWSSTSTKPSVSFAPPPPPPVVDLKRPSSGARASSRTSTPVQPLVLATAGQHATKAAEEDEDDWGDMVTSPGLENHTPVNVDSAFVAPAPPSVSEQLAKKAVEHATVPSSGMEANDDFSFFESQSPATARSESDYPTKHMANKAASALTSTPLRSTTPSLPSPPLSIQKPAAILSPAKTSVPLATARADSLSSCALPVPDEELKIFKAIVDNLPDLSYMLR